MLLAKSLRTCSWLSTLTPVLRIHCLLVYPQGCSWAAADVQICDLSIEGMHKTNLEIPMCYLDLIQGAILPSDPKQYKSWKMVNFLEWLDPCLVCSYQVRARHTHSILGQKVMKGLIREEGSVESDQFKRHF